MGTGWFRLNFFFFFPENSFQCFFEEPNTCLFHMVSEHEFIKAWIHQMRKVISILLVPWKSSSPRKVFSRFRIKVKQKLWEKDFFPWKTIFFSPKTIFDPFPRSQTSTYSSKENLHWFFFPRSRKDLNVVRRGFQKLTRFPTLTTTYGSLLMKSRIASLFPWPTNTLRTPAASSILYIYPDSTENFILRWVLLSGSVQSNSRKIQLQHFDPN